MATNPFSNKKSTRQHLVALTKELVRFPSHVQEPLKMFELVDFIKSYFEKTKVNINTHVFGGFPSLVITFEDTKHPNIMLSGHIDVVPSSMRYTAVEEGNLLHGGGAMDMKGGVACMMAIMKYFAAQKQKPSLGIMLTSDEEIGGENGTKALLENEGYCANFCIVNEGREKYDIVLREKGTLVLEFEKAGSHAHSAYPWKTDNVLEDLIAAMVDVRKIFPKPKPKWSTTATITMLNSGTSVNTIPGSARAVMNVRFTGGRAWSKEAILKKLYKVLPKDIEVSELMFGEVFLQDAKSEHVSMLRDAAQNVTKKKIRLAENHGASDARIFMEHHIPTAILGPVGLGHHTPDEYVEVESLVNHFEVLRRFIEADEKHCQKPPDNL